MKLFICVLAGVLLQFTSAQLMYGNQIIPQSLQNINTNLQKPCLASQSNALANSLPLGSLASNFIANNLGRSNYVNNLGNTNYITTASLPGNMASSYIANNLGNANYVSLGNSNYASNLGNINYGTRSGSLNLLPASYNSNVASVNLGNNLGSGVVGFTNQNTNNYISNLPVNLANGYNINTGTFSAQDLGLAAKIFGNQPCGIRILGEALEVGGPVSVNGQLPFYTTVGVNGQLPTSGFGFVSCGCGGQ